MSASRVHPRISIKQLASYFRARPAQRRRIVHNARQPAPFVANWYDAARRCIDEFILGGAEDESILTAGIDRLYGMEPASTYELARLRTNAEALQSALASHEQLRLKGLQVERAPHNAPRLSIGGVEISVRPEYLLSGEYRGEPVVGAIKLYFSKDTPLDSVSAPQIGCLLLRHLEDEYASGGIRACPRLCRVWDVFARRVYAAPAAVTRRLRDIEAACQEIAVLWPSVAA